MPALKEFLWDVNADDVSGSVAFNSKSVTMGDGYTQDIAFGINNATKSFTWSITEDYDYVKEIYNFLLETHGVTRFYWDAPFGKIKVVVSDISFVSKGGTIWTLSGKFSQRF